MRNTRPLNRVEHRLLKDLKTSTLSFADLGKRYGVSRQAISYFSQKRGINKPKKEHTKNCPVCQSIIRIAKKPYSDFTSSRTIKTQLGIGKSKWNYHISVLRKEGIVSAQFGRIHSKNVERAYQLYFKRRLSVTAIGRQVGLTNFNSVIKRHRASGFDVPAHPFKYDSLDRRKTRAKINRKKTPHRTCKRVKAGLKFKEKEKHR